MALAIKTTFHVVTTSRGKIDETHITRLGNLLAWLAAGEPDIVCLPELKAEDRAFPFADIEDTGYGAGWVGQRTWNGVAILVRGASPAVARTGPPGDLADGQARYIEAAFNGGLIGSICLPNGNPNPGPKFDDQMGWFERLLAHAASLTATGVPVVLAGDYNVVPTEADIHQPNSRAGGALVNSAARAAFRQLLDQGWLDSLRAVHPDGTLWTCWSYLRNRWPNDKGLRLDHVLLSPDLAKQLVDADDNRSVRGDERASDHAPTWIVLDS